MPRQHWIEKRLRELRNSQPRKSKAGLARALGQANARIHEIIRGERKIAADEIWPMADYLMMPPENVLNLSINRPAIPLRLPVLGMSDRNGLIKPVTQRMQAGIAIPRIDPASAFVVIVNVSCCYPMLRSGDLMIFGEPEPAKRCIDRICLLSEDDHRRVCVVIDPSKTNGTAAWKRFAPGVPTERVDKISYGQPLRLIYHQRG